MSGLSSMDKMWVSFYAIGFMAVAALIVTFARTKTKGIIRVILSLLAFVLLILGFFLGIISMF